MISRGVIIWLGIAILTGIGLFMVKYQVRALEAQLLEINRKVVANQEATHILKAEWAHLNDATRIEQLNARYLSLQPITPAQLGRIDTIPMRPAKIEQPIATVSATTGFGSIEDLLKATNVSEGAPQ
jgi:cell division protein FtsL